MPDRARRPRPGRSTLPAAVDEVAGSPGRPLDPQAAAQLSGALGHDFGQVRIHTDERAAASAAALGAKAYTHGEHIVLAPGHDTLGTPEGRRTLAHEAAHVVQQRRWGPGRGFRPGIAPADAATERQADATAEVLAEGTVTAGGRDRLRSLWALPATDRPWELHPARVTTSGRPVFGADLSAEQGGPGKVEVRVGEAVETSSGEIVSNMHAVEVSGPGVDMIHTNWLQFVWFEMVVMKGSEQVKITGGSAIGSSAGTVALTTDPNSPVWTVDSPSGLIPWYNEAALAISDSKSVAIFDKPLEGTSGLADQFFQGMPGVTEVTLAAHFDTYLVQDRQPVYHVPWGASTTFTKPSGTLLWTGISYTLGTPGAVRSLPAPLRDVLVAKYSYLSDIK